MLSNVDLIRSQIPDVRILVHSIDSAYTEALADVESVTTEGLHSRVIKAAHLIRSYAQADLFFVTGGTPIFDFRLRSRLFHFGVPWLLRIPTVFFGIGVKPVHSRRGRYLYRFFLERSKYVSVRDPEVIDQLRSLGFNGKIELTADSAVAMTKGREADVDFVLAKHGLGNRKFVAFTPIFLSVAEPNAHYHEPIREADVENAYLAMAKAADAAIVSGYDAAFIAMHRVPPDDDQEAIRAVQKLMVHPSKTIDIEEDPVLITELIARAQALVGMRLHSLVLATSRAVPVVGIGFDMKVGGYMRYVGLGEFVSPISELSEQWLVTALARCFDQRDEIVRELQERTDVWRQLLTDSVITVSGLIPPDRRRFWR